MHNWPALPATHRTPSSAGHTLAAAGPVWMDHSLPFAENARMARIALAIWTAVLLTTSADAQEMRFFYPAPQPSQVHVTRNVP